jgi:hypothetical protein
VKNLLPPICADTTDSGNGQPDNAIVSENASKNAAEANSNHAHESLLLEPEQFAADCWLLSA